MASSRSSRSPNPNLFHDGSSQRSPQTIQMDAGQHPNLEKDSNGNLGCWLDVKFPEYALEIPTGGEMVVEGRNYVCPPQQAVVRGVPKKTWISLEQMGQEYVYVTPDETYAKIMANNGMYFKSKARNEEFRFKPPAIPLPRPLSSGRVSPAPGRSINPGSKEHLERPVSVASSESLSGSPRSSPSGSGTRSGSSKTGTSGYGSAGAMTETAGSPSLQVKSPSGASSGGRERRVAKVVSIRPVAGKSLEEVPTHRSPRSGSPTGSQSASASSRSSGTAESQ